MPPRPLLCMSDPAASAEARGFVPLPVLFGAASRGKGDRGAAAILARARGLCEAWNHAEAARQALRRAASEGDEEAANTLAWMEVQRLDPAPVRPLSTEQALTLHRQIEADPAGFAAQGLPWPASAQTRHWGFDPGWAAARLASGRARLERMRAEIGLSAQTSGQDAGQDIGPERGQKIAVLVGNGPSLAKTDLSLLEGRAVFVSNYALSHPQLGGLARGVAVTNYFVASQAPQLFHPLLRADPSLPTPWRLLPVWLGHVLADSERTIWLNALGGELFFSESPQEKIAWHASVSYFWMQALLGLGYRKLLLIGFDHSYVQPAGVREGEVLRQEGDDPNHFDPGYFRGRLWQAADVDQMGAAYALAGRHWQRAGGEIVNCTIGGALEVFRRADLARELAG